jgi:hypothetical protein
MGQMLGKFPLSLPDAVGACWHLGKAGQPSRIAADMLWIHLE